MVWIVLASWHGGTPASEMSDSKNEKTKNVDRHDDQYHMVRQLSGTIFISLKNNRKPKEFNLHIFYNIEQVIQNCGAHAHKHTHNGILGWATELVHH